VTHYGIIGLGRVGSSIAIKLAANGHDVSWTDPERDTTSAAGRRTTLDEIRACDVIIECIDECRTTKILVLADLVGTTATVLTTTSSFAVTDLAAQSGLGPRLAGFHFLPSYDGKLAEITIPAGADATHLAATQLADALELGWIEVADQPGRISRRLLVPFVENVLRAAHLGIASPDDIDRVVELGLGHSVGPLRRLAAAGLDDHRATAKALLGIISTPSTTAETTAPREEVR
jgi:3-hydroxyacyl-CoA dehydrogenase